LDRFLQDDLGWIGDNSGGMYQEAASERWAAKVP